MPMQGDDTGNLFADVAPRDEESVESLIRASGARIERILSRGHASPEGFWYDQEEDEWVVLLRGRARLQIEGRAPLELAPGDWVWLPAHRRHRVDWTDPDVDTVWLAVFVGSPARSDRGS